MVGQAEAESLGRRLIHRSTDGVLIQGIDLDSSNVGIFAVLVILLDKHLHDPTAKRVAVVTTATVGNGNVLPANWVGERHLCELDQIVLSCPCIEDNVGGRVRLILGVVDVESDSANLNAADKVNRKQVRLLAIRPRVLVSIVEVRKIEQGLTASIYPSRR